jgi:hypothetical protein
MGVSGQRHAPVALYPRGKDPGTHWIGGWVGPRAGLDAGARRKILCPCRGSNPDRPARSQTLYWLSYRGSVLKYNRFLSRFVHFTLMSESGRVVSNSASYSGGSELKSRSGDRLSWLWICDFGQMLGCFKIGHDNFLPQPFSAYSLLFSWVLLFDTM